MSKATIKKIMAEVVNNTVVSGMMGFLRKENVPIFMLHRMQDKECGVKGHSPEFLRKSLTYLKENNYSFISLELLVASLNGIASIPPKSVVFTMDDGFYDQVSIAVPIFEEFNCPVSIFLLTNFSSGISWPWDYQVDYIVDTTKLNHVTINGDTISIDASLENDKDRRDTSRNIKEQLKHSVTADAERLVRELAIVLKVELGHQPPKAYLPITWDMARDCESDLVQFGPHTKSHALLAHQNDEDSKKEVQESWIKLKSELANPLPVFCYPTGRKGIDFGQREMDIVSSIGFSAALSVTPGYVNIASDSMGQERFCLARFGLPDNMEDFIQLCSWVEVVKEKLRCF